ncbi:MAG: DUF2029 domain-containing protein [Anaerolineales bacterium]|nr:DUF2029 domain-containing protein [Anaerolineales bacterium]
MKNWWPVLFFLGCFIFFVAWVIIPASQEVTHGYAAYYAGAKLFLEKGWGAQAYDNAWTSAYVLSLTEGKIAEVLAPGFPTAPLPMLLWGHLSIEAARIYWIWANGIVFLLGLGVLIISQDQQKKACPWFFMGGAMLAAPVIANFRFGQIFALIFFLLAVAVYGLIKGHVRLTGLALGFAFTIKVYGLFLWIIPVYWRNWRTLAWGIGTFLVLFLASLPWVGIDSWLAVIPAVLRTNASPEIASPAYQTTPSFMAHLFRGDPIWNPHPIFEAPFLATILPLVINVIILGITVSVLRGKPMPFWIAALMPLNTLILPNALEHHYVLFLIPIFILLANLAHPPQKVDFFTWGLLTVGIIALGVPWPYKHALFSEGWLSLLAYPRLYGGWLIWGAAIVAARNKR